MAAILTTVALTPQVLEQAMLDILASNKINKKDKEYIQIHHATRTIRRLYPLSSVSNWQCETAFQAAALHYNETMYMSQVKQTNVEDRKRAIQSVGQPTWKKMSWKERSTVLEGLLHCSSGVEQQAVPQAASSALYNAGLPGLKVSTSATPQYASAECLSQKSTTTEEVRADWDDERWSYGSGIACNLKCEHCGHGTTQLLYRAEFTQRNGNSSSRREIHCASCGTFSTIETWEEG